jgi:hypothetical protein
MKKVLLGAMFLSIMALAACGDGSSGSKVEEECIDHPELCELPVQETPAEE